MEQYNIDIRKGKVASEKVYKQRLAQSNEGKNNKLGQDKNKNVNEKASTSKLETINFSEEKKTLEKSTEKPIEGCRIVDLLYLAEQLWCTSCKECLSLGNVESEVRRGLGSVLLVKCHKCSLINSVVTGRQHSIVKTVKSNSRFDVNTKLVMGLLNSGIGFRHVNKLFVCLNIPQINFKTFKKYEAEGKRAMEAAAKESCNFAKVVL